ANRISVVVGLSDTIRAGGFVIAIRFPKSSTGSAAAVATRGASAARQPDSAALSAEAKMRTVLRKRNTGTLAMEEDARNAEYVVIRVATDPPPRNVRSGANVSRLLAPG